MPESFVVRKFDDVKISIGCVSFGPPIECPFSILYDFDRWFEWHKRTIFDGQDAMFVTCEMTGIIERMQRRIEDQFIRECLFRPHHPGSF